MVEGSTIFLYKEEKTCIYTVRGALTRTSVLGNKTRFVDLFTDDVSFKSHLRIIYLSTYIGEKGKPVLLNVLEENSCTA